MCACSLLWTAGVGGGMAANPPRSSTRCSSSEGFERVVYVQHVAGGLLQEVGCCSVGRGGWTAGGTHSRRRPGRLEYRALLVVGFIAEME